MSVESERFNPAGFVPPWTRHEHMARFAFGARYVADAVVVDCACGTGIGTRQFAEAGARMVHAYDIAPDAVHATAQRCKGLMVRVETADAAALPLADGVADVFISFETFEHLSAPEKLLAEAHRVLRLGGTLICSTPNRDVYSPGNTLDAKPWNRFHTREYNAAEFTAAVARIFRNCEFLGQNPVGAARASLMQLLGRNLPGHAAVRLNQALKLPRLIMDWPARYAVQSVVASAPVEIIVAVATK